MAIFRGTGGQGDSTTDTTVTTVTQKAAEAASSATSAANSATSASNSATSAETSATNASISESNAATSESNASTSATSAETAKTAAEAAQTAAETAETNAETAETNAETAQAAAEAAQAAAETAETNAETAEANTLAIFGNAQDVQDAVDSATASATTATTQAGIATTKAGEAASSATDAETAQTAAETAQTAAETAQGLAETAQTAAETAQTAAELAETNAETAQGLAETAQTAAETAQTAAELAETNAETAEANAATSESNAATSETNASNSASTATTQAGIATTQAGIATTKASEAASSATDAQNAQTAAETAQAAAEAAQEAIDGLYLGTNTSNPTVDLNGDPVTAGDWYFNTTDNTTRIYDGSNWNTVNPDLIGDTTPQLGGDLDLNSNDITGTGDIDITGDISLTGTVDGRDIAADGTKLDGIEDNADVTDTANVTAAGALMDSEVTNLDQVKAFNSADYATAAQGSTADTALQNVSEDTTPQLGGDLDTNGNDIKFGDNDKATFGDSDDLEIYHSGTNTFIREVGTGSLRIQGADLELSNPSARKWLKGFNNDRVELFYNNAIKLATTSSGVDVTGTLVSDGLTVDGDGIITGTGIDTTPLKVYSSSTAENGKTQITIGDTTGGGLYLVPRTNLVAERAGSGSGGRLYIQTRNESGSEPNRIKIDEAGDISFYSDDGSSQDFYWDASTSRLGLGTTTPSAPLTVATSAGTFTVDSAGGASNTIASTGALVLKSAQFQTQISQSDDTPIARFDANTGDVIFYNASESQAFYWDASTSRLGLGTTSPSQALDVSANSATIRVNDTANTNSYVDLLDSAGTFYLTSRNNTSDGSFRFRSTDGTTTKKLLQVSGNNDISFYEDTGTTAKVFWDASTERLGIGTTVPSTKLHVKQNGGGLRLQGANSDQYGAYLDFAKESGTRRGYFGFTGSGTAMIIQNDESGDIRFNTNGTEAARIDSSGNLLVGTTTSPSDTNTIVASSGVYLGGTGSANLLDDYEEGTWTPVYTPATGSFTTMDIQVVDADYVKIGRRVWVTCWIRTNDVDTTGASGALSISGLPFTASGYFPIHVGHSSAFAGEHPIGGTLNTGNTSVNLRYRSSSTSATIDSNVSDLTTGTVNSQNQVRLHVMYTTSA